MDCNLPDASFFVKVGPNECVKAVVPLPCEKPAKREIEIECCVILRKLVKREIEAHLVIEDKKEDFIGPPVTLLAPVVCFRELKRERVKRCFKLFCVPEEAVIIECKAINIQSSIEVVGFDDCFPGGSPNVKLTVCFDLVLLLSSQVNGKEKIISRQVCDLCCELFFCVPEAREGKLVATAKVFPLCSVC